MGALTPVVTVKKNFFCLNSCQNLIDNALGQKFYNYGNNIADGISDWKVQWYELLWTSLHYQTRD